MKPMDKVRKTYEEVSSPKKRSFLQFFANLSDCFCCFFWAVLRWFDYFWRLWKQSAGTMDRLLRGKAPGMGADWVSTRRKTCAVCRCGRQSRSAKGTWMVQGCGRFVWNHKAAEHGWIIRKWVFLLKALSAVCPRLSAALRATLALVRGCPRHGMFLSYFVVRGCPRMDFKREIVSIRRPCCPRLSAAAGESNILRKSSCPRTLRVFIGFWLFFGVSIDCNMYIFSAALFQLLCLFLFGNAAFQSSDGWLQTNNSVACVPLQQVVSSASALYIRTVEEPHNKTVSLLLGWKRYKNW